MPKSTPKPGPKSTTKPIPKSEPTLLDRLLDSMQDAMVRNPNLPEGSFPGKFNFKNEIDRKDKLRDLMLLFLPSGKYPSSRTGLSTSNRRLKALPKEAQSGLINELSDLLNVAPTNTLQDIFIDLNLKDNIDPFNKESIIKSIVNHLTVMSPIKEL